MVEEILASRAPTVSTVEFECLVDGVISWVPFVRSNTASPLTTFT